MRPISAALIILLALCGTAAAQEFETTFHDYDLVGYRSLGAAGALQTFEPRSDNSLPDSLAIRFDSPMFFLEFRQMDLRIAASYSHYTLHGEGKSSYSIYADGSTDLPVSARRSGGLYIPIIVATNYVRAEGLGTSSGIFDVGSIGIGTGLKYRYLSEAFGLQLSGGAVIHYSTVGFSIENGSSVAARGEFQLLLPELLWSGMTIGYRFETQQWRMSEAKFNYMRRYHAAFLGIFF
ncbi:MAG: hypothetical protein ACM3Q4_02360 [Acidobacteriota bacterium]